MIIQEWCTPATIPQLFQRSVLFFRQHWESLLRITLIILIPIQLIALGADWLIRSTQIISLIGWTIVIIASIGGQLWLTAALIYHLLQLGFDTEHVSIGDTLKIATQFVSPILRLYVLMMLIILAVAMCLSLVLMVFIPKSAPASLPGMLLFLLVMVLFLIYPRFFLAPFYLVADSVRVQEALQMSNRLFLVNPSKNLIIFMSFIILNLIVLGLNLVSTLLSFISSILIIPFGLILQFLLFIDLKIKCGELTFSNESEATHDEN